MSVTSPRRIAVLSVHTSPLELPGSGDAGGMNVYVRQTATRMARRGVEVDVFTRATSAEQPPSVELTAGVTVHHVRAGPYAGLDKHDLPAQLDEFSAGVTPGDYSAMHSHYWLSGQVGRELNRRWRIPLIHSAHTLAKVKNAARAAEEPAEPQIRTNGEQLLADEADRLVANTEIEAQQLVRLYAAERSKVLVIPPGVDLDVFTPGDTAKARAELGIPADALVLGFVGRIQPLKAPDVLVRAAAELLRTTPSLRDRLVLLIVGGPSGSGRARPTALIELARELGIADITRFCPPRSGAALATAYRAMDLLAVPSHNESFGLVALEAQACGTPVVAARVGGLPIAVQHASTGLLVDGHHPVTWGAELTGLLTNPMRRGRYVANAVRHAARYSWERTTDALLRGYRCAAAGVRTRRADEEIAV